MNRPPFEENQSADLLGYVLGALEPHEQEQVEQLLAGDPSLHRQLQHVRSQLDRRDGLDPPGPPPAGLARRTCERIAPLLMAHVAKKRSWLSSRREPLSNHRGWSLSDFITFAVIALVLTAVIIPAVNQSRFQSRLLNCQNNLRTVGRALLEYAQNRGGKHVEIPRQGNLAVAGFYATELCSSGYIDDGSLFLCPGRGTQDRFVPSCQEVLSATDEQLVQLQRKMGGDYAFTLGHFDKRGYVAPRYRAGSNFVLLADKPSNELPGRASQNHGGKGQNCFFDDGHVELLATPTIAEDSIYENDWAQVAPGTHVYDNVVAPSQTRLMALE